ncbi:MAG: DUF1156 domain-containing protein [Elusimicrobia bacterium]|nr:DUF1156 domain-containing protein [Elusimicrobiota bacterium]
MIERDFDISFVANLALREKQIQQNYRPIIAVHKWFARRPGTLFRSLILSEFVNAPLQQAYFKGHHLGKIRVADPFMGGGTPLLEANRMGCEVFGYDINPMSYWIVRQEIEHLDLDLYRQAASALRVELEREIGYLYRTTCTKCSSETANVKYWLWIKTQRCQACRKDIDLFPGFLIAGNIRHPKNVFVCGGCGEIVESNARETPVPCANCKADLSVEGPAKRGRITCPHCRMINKFPASNEVPRHRLFAIEYYCPKCRDTHEGRFFKRPDSRDISKYKEAERRLKEMCPRFIPDEKIPPGDETERLHRWGYTYYKEMFNSRQLLSLELSCRIIEKQSNERVRNALATNLSDLLRYQNMLCRYDSMALKSLDIFSVHGFPVGRIQCESNFLGVTNGRDSANIGSGGWSNIIDKFIKAKAYCNHPYEIRHDSGRKSQIPIQNEWIGDQRHSISPPEKRKVVLHCGNAMEAELPDQNLDAVLTDPPYYGNVQYAELMDFCYVWLRRLLPNEREFAKPSTRDSFELTRNASMGRGMEHFAEGLAGVFHKMACALKNGAPLAFTYHHNDIEAYYPVAMAILDSGLVCSASLPCPAEMGGSIHINGTGSSIIDTVFVCRSTGTVPKRWISRSAQDIATMVADDCRMLQAGSVKPSQGDIRCITYGHLVRLAIWYLKKGWDRRLSTNNKLGLIAAEITKLGGAHVVHRQAQDRLVLQPNLVRESKSSYGDRSGAIRF